MKISPTNPPRTFEVGYHGTRLADCARIGLEPDEQVTFITPSGGEYDVVRKVWGFYATPSLNRRLPQFGLRPALARSTDGKHFVLLMERGQQAAFEKYLDDERMILVCWLDQQAALDSIGGRTTEQTHGV
jgi:hypothetical protein